MLFQVISVNGLYFIRAKERAIKALEGEKTLSRSLILIINPGISKEGNTEKSETKKSGGDQVGGDHDEEPGLSYQRFTDPEKKLIFLQTGLTRDCLISGFKKKDSFFTEIIFIRMKAQRQKVVRKTDFASKKFRFEIRFKDKLKNQEYPRVIVLNSSRASQVAKNNQNPSQIQISEILVIGEEGAFCIARISSKSLKIIQRAEGRLNISPKGKEQVKKLSKCPKSELLLIYLSKSTKIGINAYASRILIVKPGYANLVTLGSIQIDNQKITSIDDLSIYGRIRSQDPQKLDSSLIVTALANCGVEKVKKWFTFSMDLTRHLTLKTHNRSYTLGLRDGMGGGGVEIQLLDGVTRRFEHPSLESPLVYQRGGPEGEAEDLLCFLANKKKGYALFYHL